MKSVKGTISEALAQVAAYNKEQRPVVEAEAPPVEVEAETLDERETDKYGNPKLSDADKDKIGKLREQIAEKEKELNKLKIQIAMIKKAAGLPL